MQQYINTMKKEWDYKEYLKSRGVYDF